jgi:hypothetical protein
MKSWHVRDVPATTHVITLSRLQGHGGLTYDLSQKYAGGFCSIR